MRTTIELPDELLAQAKVSDTCMTCHNGTASTATAIQGPNVALALTSTYPHDTKSAVNITDQIPHNVDCKDCHEPHTMRMAASSPTAPGISTVQGAIDGQNIAGSPVTKAQYDYEVCLKCHADKPAGNPLVSRKIVQTNVRLKFEPGAVAFHPVATKGKNTDVPSLRTPYTTDSIISCMDSHGSDQSKKVGGTGANGPHGSTYTGQLLARYEMTDLTSYSTSAYALCFRCHDNTQVVADSGPFPFHKTHVQDKSTPCSACHDSHGIPGAQGNMMNNAALINFDTSIVLPDSVTHKIEFLHTGSRHGTCTLLCHGKQHSATAY